MKAISAIIVVVMLLLISIALISVVYLWAYAMTGTVTEAGTESTTELTKTMTGLIRIESVYGHTIYLKNVGQTDLSDFLVFIDDNNVQITKIIVDGIEADKISKGKMGEIVINVTGVPIKKEMKLKISSSATFPQTVYIKPMENLVDNSSFEEGVWGDAGDCNCGICSCAGGSCTPIPGGFGCGSYAIPPAAGCSAFFTAFSADGYISGKSLNLTGTNAVACNAITMNNFQSGKTYTFSFRYKHIRGVGGNFCIWVGGCNTCNPAIPGGSLTSVSWDSYTITFNPELCTTNLSPYFYAGGDSQISENLYDDVYLIEGFKMV